MGLELGRGGARWIDRSVDGSSLAGACANRRSGRNSRSRAGDRATRRRRRTPRARAIDDAPDSGRGFARSFPSPRCFGAPNIASRARAWWSREGARCANAETTRRNFAGIARRSPRAVGAHASRREGGKNRTNWEVPRSVAAQRARTPRASNAVVAREEVFLRRGDSSASPSRAPPRSASVLAPPIVDRSSSRSIDRWPPRRREEERRHPIRSASGWRPRRSRRRPPRSRARRRDGRPPRAIPRASRRERPQAPRPRPRRRLFARRTSPAARSEAARRRPHRADSDTHPRRRPTSSASSSACAARAWTCTTLGSSTCARAKPRSESRSCSGISPGRGTTSTETARRDTLVRSR